MVINYWSSFFIILLMSCSSIKKQVCEIPKKEVNSVIRLELKECSDDFYSIISTQIFINNQWKRVYLKRDLNYSLLNKIGCEVEAKKYLDSIPDFVSTDPKSNLIFHEEINLNKGYPPFFENTNLYYIENKADFIYIAVNFHGVLNYYEQNSSFVLNRYYNVTSLQENQIDDLLLIPINIEKINLFFDE